MNSGDFLKIIKYEKSVLFMSILGLLFFDLYIVLRSNSNIYFIKLMLLFNMVIIAYLGNNLIIYKRIVNEVK